MSDRLPGSEQGAIDPVQPLTRFPPVETASEPPAPGSTILKGRRVPCPPARWHALCGLLAPSDVLLNGSITINGNNHDFNGGLIPNGAAGSADDVLGIASDENLIAGGGSARVGGNGLAPAKAMADARLGANPATVQSGYIFPTGFPMSGDEVLKVPANSLKVAAQASNTYFTSVKAFNDAVNANGGYVPEGKIIFLDLNAPGAGGGALGLGNPNKMNVQPSIMVVTNSDAMNIHGEFKGLFVVDEVMHINGSANFLGAVVSTGPAPDGNVFGNGNADIKFSAEVLTKLPSAGGDNCRILSWRRVMK